MLYNSGLSTGEKFSLFVCGGTYDKAFVLSQQDYLNINYGFDISLKGDAARICETSDWTIANGGENDYFA